MNKSVLIACLLGLAACNNEQMESAASQKEAAQEKMYFAEQYRFDNPQEAVYFEQANRMLSALNGLGESNRSKVISQTTEPKLVALFEQANQLMYETLKNKQYPYMACSEMTYYGMSIYQEWQHIAQLDDKTAANTEDDPELWEKYRERRQTCKDEINQMKATLEQI